MAETNEKLSEPRPRELEGLIVHKVKRIREGLHMGPNVDLSALIQLAVELKTDLKLRFAVVGTAEDLLREHRISIQNFMRKLPSLVRGQCNCSNLKGPESSWDVSEKSQRPCVRITVSEEDWPALPTGEALAHKFRAMPIPWNRVTAVQKH